MLLCTFSLRLWGISSMCDVLHLTVTRLSHTGPSRLQAPCFESFQLQAPLRVASGATLLGPHGSRHRTSTSRLLTHLWKISHVYGKSLEWWQTVTRSDEGGQLLEVTKAGTV